MTLLSWEFKRHFRVYLTIDDEVAVQCRDCAEREFGQHNPSDEG
jgi:hypothetical protein